MIEEYFNLTKAPFRLSTDTEFYYDSPRHRKALSYLQYGYQQAEGIVVVAGDAGVGKSMMIEQLLVELSESDVLVVTISPGPASQEEVLEHILAGFQIEAMGSGKVAQLEALKEFLADQHNSGSQVLLVVDEAQNLSREALDEIRQLTNYKLNNAPMIQVFLVGQPALARMVQLPEMEQLKQRVIASCELEPLTKEETENYIEHRMFVSGWHAQESIFTNVAHQKIFEHSGGVPRKINTLCTRLLLQVTLDQKDAIDLKVFEKVAADLAAEALGRPQDDGTDPNANPEEDNYQKDAALNESATIPEESYVEITEGAKKDNIVPFHQSEEVINMTASTQNQQESVTDSSKHEATSGGGGALGGDPDDKAPSTDDQHAADVLVSGDTSDSSGKEEASVTPASLEQLAEQISAEVDSVLPEQEQSGNEASRGKLTGMKSEVQKLVGEVQEGLVSIEGNMTVLRDRLTELEEQRAVRGTLIVYHLQRIDDVLKRMTDSQ